MDESTNLPGRPAFEPTPKDRANVLLLAQCGTRQEDIAKVIGISVPTLRKYFPDELERGEIVATAKVAHSLYKAATDPAKPNITAAIFWLKVRGGWREADNAETPRKPTPLGKKEAAAEAAAAAVEADDEWGELLRPRGGAHLQ